MMLWVHFDRNEWFVLLVLAAAYAALWLLPKRLPRSVTITALVWGFAGSTLFDFTIGGGLMDFYMVNDSNHYELTDLLVYFMFAPFGYIFIYFYERLGIRGRKFILYVVGWSLIGAAFQAVAASMGMTHYQHGYRPEYNFAVFLVMQSLTGLYYEYLKRSDPNADPRRKAAKLHLKREFSR
jgi:hypothetical protein